MKVESDTLKIYKLRDEFEEFKKDILEVFKQMPDKVPAEFFRKYGEEVPMRSNLNT